jgi:hypothetical protein
MCNSMMKYKTRLLFIGIAISFLIGCFSKADFFTSEYVETSVGSSAETLFIQDDSSDSEEIICSESSSETHIGDALRRFSQTKRVSNSSSPRYGLIFAKRKHYFYTATPHFESFRRFPSGLMEGKQYLISLGRLII